ncbi:MAG: hypothetical protein ACYCSF_11845 [Acidimicrobiales bacterium]
MLGVEAGGHEIASTLEAPNCGVQAGVASTGPDGFEVVPAPEVFEDWTVKVYWVSLASPETVDVVAVALGARPVQLAHAGLGTIV